MAKWRIKFSSIKSRLANLFRNFNSKYKIIKTFYVKCRQAVINNGRTRADYKFVRRSIAKIKVDGREIPCTVKHKSTKELACTSLRESAAIALNVVVVRDSTKKNLSLSFLVLGMRAAESSTTVPKVNINARGVESVADANVCVHNVTSFISRPGLRTVRYDARKRDETCYVTILARQENARASGNNTEYFSSLRATCQVFLSLTFSLSLSLSLFLSPLHASLLALQLVRKPVASRIDVPAITRPPFRLE